MRVTAYPNRVAISMTQTEFELLRIVVEHGLSDMVDPNQFAALSIREQRVLATKRWSQLGGPLATIDTTKGGRGGYAVVEQ